MKKIIVLIAALPMLGLFAGCNQTMEAGANRATDAMDTRGGAVGIAESTGVLKPGTASVGRKTADFLFGKSLINPIAPGNGWKFHSEMRYSGKDPLDPNAVVERGMIKGYAEFTVEYDPFVGIPFSAPIDLSLYAENVKAVVRQPSEMAAPQWTDSGVLAIAIESMVEAADAEEGAK